MKCYENGTVECVEYRCLSQSSFCRSVERAVAKHALKTGEDPPPDSESIFFLQKQHQCKRRAKHSSNCTLTEMCAKVTPLASPRPATSPLSTAPIVLLVGPVFSSLHFCASPQTWYRWRCGRGTSIMCGEGECVSRKCAVAPKGRESPPHPRPPRC